MPPLFDEPINLDPFTADPIEMMVVSNVLARMSFYAEHKAIAMRTRLAGDIPTALAEEKKAGNAYVLLPEWARW
jgi:hypothetical protein